MIIRNATLKDIRFIFNLYNFYISKNLFYRKKKISFLEHKKWFLKSFLKEKKSIIYIANYKNRKIGYVRFSEVNKKIFEISLALKIKFFGNNRGTLLLYQALKRFNKKKLKIIARVKNKNIGSVICLKKNNFFETKYQKKLFGHVANSKNYIYMVYKSN